jgi:dodecin
LPAACRTGWTNNLGAACKHCERRNVMAVARVSKITAASTKSFQEATEEGLERATKTLRGVTGFEVISMKGKVEKGKVTEYRVTLEVTFILE